jgi:hypothetical protein
MDFIYYIYFIRILYREKPNSLSQLADLVDTTIRGAIDLHHIHCGAICDLKAMLALIAWVIVDRGEAVQSFS